MKNKYFHLLLTAVTLSTSANAALYTSDFQSFGALDQIGGNDGWSIDDATADISFVTTLDGNAAHKALGLGGYNAGPANAAVALTHGHIDEVGRITTTFEFSIFDSTDLYPNRDTFSFAIKDGSGDLFSVSFVPDAQNATPSSSTAGWTAHYAINGGSNTSWSIGLDEASSYAFSLALSPSGADTSYTVNIGGHHRTGIATGLSPTTMTTDFGVKWNTFTGVAATAGDGYIGIDNLTVVPEPSSSLLLAIAGLGLVSRRKRA